MVWGPVWAPLFAPVAAAVLVVVVAWLSDGWVPPCLPVVEAVAAAAAAAVVDCRAAAYGCLVGLLRSVVAAALPLVWLGSRAIAG